VATCARKRAITFDRKSIGSRGVRRPAAATRLCSAGRPLDCCHASYVDIVGHPKVAAVAVSVSTRRVQTYTPLSVPQHRRIYTSGDNGAILSAVIAVAGVLQHFNPQFLRMELQRTKYAMKIPGNYRFLHFALFFLYRCVVIQHGEVFMTNLLMPFRLLHLQKNYGNALQYAMN